MLSITDRVSLTRALAAPLDERVKGLLTNRQKLLGGDIADLAHFVILQPGDTPAELEQVLGFSVFQNAGDGAHFGEADFTPSWEWIEDHGFAYELVFIFDDSGFAHVVLIPKEEGIDVDLARLCSTYAHAHA